MGDVLKVNLNVIQGIPVNKPFVMCFTSHNNLRVESNVYIITEKSDVVDFTEIIKINVNARFGQSDTIDAADSKTGDNSDTKNGRCDLDSCETGFVNKDTKSEPLDKKEMDRYIDLQSKQFTGISDEEKITSESNDNYDASEYKMIQIKIEPLDENESGTFTNNSPKDGIKSNQIVQMKDCEKSGIKDETDNEIKISHEDKTKGNSGPTDKETKEKGKGSLEEDYDYGVNVPQKIKKEIPMDDTDKDSAKPDSNETDNQTGYLPRNVIDKHNFSNAATMLPRRGQYEVRAPCTHVQKNDENNKKRGMPFFPTIIKRPRFESTCKNARLCENTANRKIISHKEFLDMQNPRFKTQITGKKSCKIIYVGRSKLPIAEPKQPDFITSEPKQLDVITYKPTQPDIIASKPTQADVITSKPKQPDEKNSTIMQPDEITSNHQKPDVV